MKYKTTYADVGRMRQRVELQSYTTTADGQGGSTATWATDETIWADIQPNNGSERWEIESLKGNVSHTARIRQRPVDNSMRLKYGSRIFYIKYAFNDGEDNAYTTLALKEEV
jgi:SPP1 family predicted phage head-tail adaptor